MTATLSGFGLSGEFGDHVLFDNLDVVLAPGERVGLVGANGSGKSTLLRVLAGELAPAAGEVVVSPRDAAIGYLPQSRSLEAGCTVKTYIKSRTGVLMAQIEMESWAERLSQGFDGSAASYSLALEKWLGLGGGDFDERLEAVAERLALSVNLDQRVETLSGGQVARVGLASLLLSRFDLLLLDEPTNDLDVSGLEFLEEFVVGLDVGCLLVSHDREFLSRTCTSVLEIDSDQHLTRFVRGGYDAFLTERQRQRDASRDSYEIYADRRQALLDRARRQRAWMEKGMAAGRRSSGESDKIGRKARIEATGQQASKARQTERMIERLEVVDEPRKEWQLQLSIPVGRRSGELVCELSEACADRGESFRVGPVNLRVSWGERIAIEGANGSGKTSLLNLMLGRLEPSSGIVRQGAGLIIGEIDQQRLSVSEGCSADDFLAELVPDLDEASRRSILAKFRLGAGDVFRPVSSLSQGEKTRLLLTVLQARGANLLVLDEPTNHLDLPAIEQLEEAVASFPGTVLLVTHDRRFLANVRLTRRLVVEEGRVEEVSM